MIALLGVFISFLFSLKNERMAFHRMEDEIPVNRNLYYANQIFYQSEYQKEIRTNSSILFFNILKNAFKDKIDVIYKWRKKFTFYDF